MKRVRLAALGDSLTQGFMSGAISRTDLSYPAMISMALGCFEDFKAPDFTYSGGLPVNIEFLLRKLTAKLGNRIELWEYPRAARIITSYLMKNAGYWMKDGRSNFPVNRDCYHNQSVWGFKLQDAYLVTDRLCSKYLNKNSRYRYDFYLKSSVPKYITALRVFAADPEMVSDGTSQVTNLERLAQERGIENLIVWLGSNCCLGAVTSLKIKLSEESDLDSPPHATTANLYRPEHFALLLGRLAERLKTVGARRVFIANIPHVTIPPITTGISFDKVNPLMNGYFEYYTRMWIWDDEFDPERHEYLTRDQAVLIDEYVDSYNQIIGEYAERFDWHVVDVCYLLDRLAYRRHQGKVTYKFPNGLVKALRNNPSTSYLIGEDGSVMLDTNFLALISPDDPRLSKGGLFSLDGMHPTTIAYGLIADLFIKSMKSAGVRFETNLLWDYITASDTLVTDPPPILGDLQRFFNAMASERSNPLLLSRQVLSS